MPLQTTGPISLTNIRTQFGSGATPHALSEYYAGAANGYVPAGTSGTGGVIPSSGTIQFSDFYGAPTGIYDFTITVGYNGTGEGGYAGVNSGLIPTYGSIIPDPVTLPDGSSIVSVRTTTATLMGGGTVDFTWIGFYNGGALTQPSFTSLILNYGNTPSETFLKSSGGQWLTSAWRWAGDSMLNGVLLGTVIPCRLVL